MDLYDASSKFIYESVARSESEKGEEMEEETECDGICSVRSSSQDFHSYLMKKEHVMVEDVLDSMRRVGLLFL